MTSRVLLALGTLVGLLGAWPAAPQSTVPELIPYLRKETGTGIRESAKRWGYADPEGRLVIPAQFEVARFFSEDGLARVRRNGRWGMIDRQGREVVPIAYHGLEPFSDGLAAVSVESGQPIPGVHELGPRPGQRKPLFTRDHGFLNRQGQIAIPLDYFGAFPFREGVARVTQPKRAAHCRATHLGHAVLWGMIDTQGRLVLPIEHCHIGPAEDGWIRVKYDEPLTWDANGGPYDGRVGFVDRAGRVLIPPLPYDWVGERWSEGYVPVRRQGRYGFVDRQGREVIAPRFEEISGFKEGLARVKLGGKWGFVDPAGAVRIPFQYDSDAGDFDGGLACVKIGDRTGFVDRDGKLAIPARFDWSWSCNRYFREGLRPTPQGGKWGYIDRAGAFVIPPRFDEAWAFSEGLAAVRQDALWGFVDATGRLVIPPRYFRVDSGFDRGLAHVTVRQPDPCCQGVYRFSDGFIDRRGREFFDPP